MVFFSCKFGSSFIPDVNNLSHFPLFSWSLFLNVCQRTNFLFYWLCLLLCIPYFIDIFHIFLLFSPLCLLFLILLLFFSLIYFQISLHIVSLVLALSWVCFSSGLVTSSYTYIKLTLTDKEGSLCLDCCTMSFMLHICFPYESLEFWYIICRGCQSIIKTMGTVSNGLP